MSQPFVSIRAAPSAGDGTPQPSPVREQAALKKRRAVNVACNSCRSKRVRCDGQRPTCSNCRGLACQCVYRNEADISPESKRVVVEIIQTLSRLPGPDVMRVLTSLATETNAANILSVLRNETRSPTTANVATSGNNDEVFEFAVQNPVAYPLLQATAFLEKRDFKLDLSSTSSHSKLPRHQLQPAANQFSNHQEEASPNLCDPRLQNLNISLWTSVQISNKTAARCISLYLQTDHPLLGHFDSDLFVSHLVSGNDDYCSPLLVNALLYWACQMYSCVDSQTDELTMPFCKEAERLWKVERDQGRDSVASIAAVELICLGYLGQGRDGVILYYISEASLMGTRMGLFGIDDGGTGEEGPIVAKIVGDNENWRAHAAWGVFNWIT